MIKEMEITTNNAEETRKTGKFLAQEILAAKEKRKNALIVALEGNLGAGKTTFIQGLAQELGVLEQIASPTFVIMKKYPVQSSQVNFFYHFDCYRLDSSKDILDLGFEEIASQSGNLIVIEWAERIKDILPADALWLRFEHLNQDQRKISFGIKLNKK